MRILMLNYEFPPLGGGAGNAMHYLLKEFSKEKNIFIDVITSSPGKYAVEHFSDNIKIYKLDVAKKNHHYQTFFETFLWSVKTFSFMKAFLKETKYDLCHPWFGWPCGFFGYINKKKLPYIVSLRGTDVPGFNPRFKILDKIFFNRISSMIWKNAAYVTANSEGLKELAYKTRKGDIKVIYNGIDTYEFFPPKKTHKEVVLLCVARLIKRKGIEYLIRAMPDIVSENKKIKLIIVGEGPEKESLMDLASELKVDKIIEFKGKESHDNMPQIYQNADIFILPSLYEGMSNTVLEAIASGLPVITTDTGGTKELIRGNGIIIRKQSSEDISRSVLTLANDRKRLEKLRMKSWKTALKFSWKKIAEEYLKLYKKTAK